jgi:hypothetical protein
MTFNLKKSIKSIGLVGIVGLAWWAVTNINAFQDAVKAHEIMIAQHTKELDKLQDKVDKRC